MQLRLVRTRENVQLGQEVGRGGEGIVYLIEGQPHRVAKIYGAPPVPRKVQKLVAMTEAAGPALRQVAAWPIDLLADARGVVKGLVMPRIGARRDIHELYGPKSRSEAFPEADLQFLVHVGANVARAFAVVHEYGNVIGDVNHGNLLVGSNGTVTLIDCDSFQIGTGPDAFACDVGTALFTAPELQGKPLRGLLRTVNHDLFALAVTLFHLLYMGRHPFAGRYLGAGEMPIEKAIAEYRFAYGRDRAAKAMERPPGTVPLEAMGQDAAASFELAFSKEAVNGRRPDARNWIRVLESLKSTLHVCSATSVHQYTRELSSCPWCAVEAQTGVRLFGLRITPAGPAGAVDISRLWQAIMAVPDPGPDPVLPSEREWHAPTAVKLPNIALINVRKALSIILALGGIVAFNAVATGDGAAVWMFLALGLAVAVWPRIPPQKRAAIQRTHAAAKAEFEGAISRWRRESSRRIFAEGLKRLETARAELADMPNERRRRLAKLEAQRETKQKQRYLDRFRIDRAAIYGIGPSRQAMLASYGIETAADVDWTSVKQIPGFGEVLTDAVVTWRLDHEQNFRFSPNEPVDQRDVVVMDRELESRRLTLLSQLQSGPNTLKRLRQEVVSGRTRLMPIVEKAWDSYKIAEAELKVL